MLAASFGFSVLLGAIYSFLNAVINAICRLRFGTLKNVIPSIKDRLLLEPAVTLAEKIRNKELTSEEVVKSYIERIRQIHPIVNAVIDERFEAALQDAKNVDEFLRQGTKTPQELAQEQPFLGVPFTTKNTLGVKGLAQDAGIVNKKCDKADEDCEVVALMRRAGAIPLVVTNVPELSLSWDTTNQIHGRTKNPYDLARSPGGSSGGEGTLIASAASIFGIGNDIAGSIRIPASFCGIFGHKPTSGLVSNGKQFPSCEGTILDTYRCTGPMCRYACDLLPLLKVLAGKQGPTKIKFEEQIDLRQISIYYTDDYINHPQVSPVNEEVRIAVKKAVAYLKEKFHVKAEAVSIPELNEVVSIAMPCVIGHRADVFTSLMKANQGEVQLMTEFPKWLFGRSEHTFFCLMLALHIKAWSFKDPRNKIHIESVLKRLRARFDTFLHQSVFIFPTNPEVAPYSCEATNKAKNITYTSVFNLLGFPSTVCPVGLNSEGLPVGIQVVGRHYSDATTIAVAGELERGFGGWKAP